MREGGNRFLYVLPNTRSEKRTSEIITHTPSNARPCGFIIYSQASLIYYLEVHDPSNCSQSSVMSGYKRTYVIFLITLPSQFDKLVHIHFLAVFSKLCVKCFNLNYLRIVANPDMKSFICLG